VRLLRIANRCTLSASMKLTEEAAKNKRIFGRGAGGRNEGLTADFPTGLKQLFRRRELRLPN
jgi:hypothetical protein